MSNGVGVLATLFALAILLPTLAVAVRRLHDTDRSGWWIIAPAVAYWSRPGSRWALRSRAVRVPDRAGRARIGLRGSGPILAIVLLVFYIQKGTAGPNTYGPDPLGQGA